MVMVVKKNRELRHRVSREDQDNWFQTVPLPREWRPLPEVEPDELPTFFRRPSTANEFIGLQRWEAAPINLAFLVLIGLLALGYWYLRSSAVARRLIPSIPAVQLAVPALVPDLESPAENHVTYRLRQGDSVSDVLKQFGLNRSDAPALEKGLAAIKPDGEKPASLEAGQNVQLAFDSAGVLSELRLYLPSHRSIVVSRGGEGFEPSLVEDNSTVQEIVSMGEIRSSFSAAAQRTGLSYQLVDDLVDLFADRVEFSRDFRPGDRFTVIYRNEPDTRSGKKRSGASQTILAAALTVNGKTFIATRYVGTDGKARYFDDSGKLFGSQFLRFPLQFTRITSTFTTARFHPVLHITRPHNGVDFAAPVGTPVRTVGNGRVVFAGYKGPNGNMVEIRHNDRYTTDYLHLSRIAPGITRGTAVTKGQLIGNVGTTGLSTGPHLHFGLFDRGTYTNPLTAKLPIEEKLGKGLAVGRKYLNRVLFTLEHYQTVALENRSVQ